MSVWGTETYAPDFLFEYPDNYQFPISDEEVYGKYGPVRLNSMRVQDCTPTTGINSQVRTKCAKGTNMLKGVRLDEFRKF